MAKITQNTAGHSCTMTMNDTKSLTAKTSKRCAVLLDLTNDGCRWRPQDRPVPIHINVPPYDCQISQESLSPQNDVKAQAPAVHSPRSSE
jgi:hypothetical protein